MKTFKELREGKGADLYTMLKAIEKIIKKMEKYKAPKDLIIKAKKLEDDMWQWQSPKK